MKPVYLIRHKPTGFFMPEPTGNQGRGSSFWEPKEQADYPRIFRYERSAKSALVQWLRGTHHAIREYESNDFTGGGFWYDDGTEVTPVATRHKEDMEIIPMYLTEQLPN